MSEQDKPKKAEKTRLEKLVNKLSILEKQIEIALSELDNYGGECHCDKYGELNVKIVHQGSMFDEIITYCAYCGGIVV